MWNLKGTKHVTSGIRPIERFMNMSCSKSLPETVSQDSSVSTDWTIGF